MYQGRRIFAWVYIAQWLERLTSKERPIKCFVCVCCVFLTFAWLQTIARTGFVAIASRAQFEDEAC